jgi:hypothetical protein
MRIRILILVLSAAVVACGSDRPTMTGLLAINPVGQAVHPKTCAELKEYIIDTNGELADGHYTLYVGGREDAPWSAYCYGMRWDEDPPAYIDVNPAVNYSEALHGGAVMRTQYSKLRVRPATFEIDALDDRFATTVNAAAGAKRPHLPAGFAQVNGVGAPTAASVDLRGTGFGFVPNPALACVNSGQSALSGANVLDDRATLWAYNTDAATRATAWMQHGCNSANDWSQVPSAIVWRVRYTGQ